MIIYYYVVMQMTILTVNCLLRSILCIVFTTVLHATTSTNCYERLHPQLLLIRYYGVWLFRLAQMRRSFLLAAESSATRSWRHYLGCQSTLSLRWLGYWSVCIVSWIRAIMVLGWCFTTPLLRNKSPITIVTSSLRAWHACKTSDKLLWSPF